MDIESEGLKKGDKKTYREDETSDYILNLYQSLMSDSFKIVRIVLCITPILVILAFAFFISNSNSNLIAFFALVNSIVFIFISFLILGWILE